MPDYYCSPLQTSRKFTLFHIRYLIFVHKFSILSVLTFVDSDINLDLWVDIFCRKNEISNLFNSELLSPILCVYLNPQMPKHRCKVYDEFSEEWSFIKWGRWHFIVIWIVKVKVTQSCLTFCDSMDCSMPGSSVHGVLQARTLEWVAIPFFRGSSQPRDQTLVSCIAGRFFTIWATREASLSRT